MPNAYSEQIEERSYFLEQNGVNLDGEQNFERVQEFLAAPRLNLQPVISAQTNFEIFRDNVQEAVQVICNPCESIAGVIGQVRARVRDLEHSITEILRQHGFFRGCHDPEGQPIIENSHRNGNN